MNKKDLTIIMNKNASLRIEVLLELWMKKVLLDGLIRGKNQYLFVWFALYKKKQHVPKYRLNNLKI